ILTSERTKIRICPFELRMNVIKRPFHQNNFNNIYCHYTLYGKQISWKVDLRTGLYQIWYTMAMPKRKVQISEKAQHITIDHHQLYYRVAGSGKPLVLIHGYGTSGHIWQHAFPYLAQQHEVFIVDLPGYGRSRTDGVWHLREMAPILAQWLQKLQLPSVALMGHSMGGAIAIHLTAHAPAQIERLVLVNAAGIPLYTPLPALATRSLHSMFQFGNGSLPLPLIRDVLQPRIQLLWQNAQEMKRSDFRAELAQINIPTL